jgi:MFS family permease
VTRARSTDDGKRDATAIGSGIWLAVVAAAVVGAIAMGLRQALGLYLAPVTQELNLGRESFALSIAIANLVWGVAAPFAGFIADRYGAARVVAFGGLTTAAGFLSLHVVETEFQLFLSGVLLGLGVAGAGISALVGIVARAVPEHMRTEAISWVGFGSGVGMLVSLPYAHVLMEETDWQQSLLVLALTALFILPLAFFLRQPPRLASVGADLGSHPPELPVSGVLKSALVTPSYWFLMAGFFVCGFHVVFYATHLPAFVSDAGLPSWVGVAGLMLVGLGNLFGNLLAGWWGRSRPLRHGLMWIYFGRSLVFLGFLVLPTTTFTVLALSAVLGVLWLSTVPLTSGLVSVFFGARWLTMLYGIVFLSHQLGSFAGVWLAGSLYDATLSYNAMWWICVGLGVFAGLLHVPIKEADVRDGGPEQLPAA